MTSLDGRATRVGAIRWLMVGLVFTIAAVSYLDRSNIAIAASYIKRDLSLSDVQLGMVFSAFVLGYALTQPIAGRIADRYGPYRVICIGVIWWSLFTAFTAALPSTFAGAFSALLVVRFLLGVGESVIFPASNRLVANWIPARERGLANGLIFAGVGVGAGVAPMLITSIMLTHDWRTAFFACAGAGLVVLAVWMLAARGRPKEHPWIKPAELVYIEAGRPDPTPAYARRPAPWIAIIFNRQIALLTLSYFCFGYVAYMFFTWFFTYLSTVRGLDLKSSGLYGTLPFAAMAVASPLGGWLSDRLASRLGDRKGRCLIAALGMALTAVFLTLATQVADARLASMVLAAGSGSLYLSQSAFWTLSANLGRSSAGSVSGVMNMGNQLGGVLVASLTPVLAHVLGWSGSFVFAAGVALIGAVAWLFIDPYAPLAEA